METDMIGKIPRSVGATLTVLAILAVSAATASAGTVYNNLPKPKPKNTVSHAFEATATSELGAAVKFAGTLRANPSVTIVLSSWACQEGAGTGCRTSAGATFNWPVTVKLYKLEAGAIGPLVSESTKTLAIPYRPSANNRACAPNAEGAVGYTSECFHGKEAKFTFPLAATLPEEAVIAVAYNTTNYGASPVGPQACSAFNPSRCGYDSLNVGLEEGSGASVGTQPLPEDAFLDSTYGGAYCDGGAGGTGSLRLDAGCWGGSQPMLKVTASR
jgi:hypothetical protein